MSAKPQHKWTVDEYLAFERKSETRHELVDGEIFEMAGASRAHGRIRWNLSGALYPQLESRGCEGFAGDMRVRIPTSDRYAYPDLVVVCEEPRFRVSNNDLLRGRIGFRSGLLEIPGGPIGFRSGLLEIPGEPIGFRSGLLEIPGGPIGFRSGLPKVLGGPIGP